MNEKEKQLKEKFKDMKKFIYDKFLNKLNDVENISKVIDNLQGEDKVEFIEELLKRCEFSCDDFFSSKENQKINLLCYLNEKGKLGINNDNKQNNCVKLKNIKKLENTLDDIKRKLDGGLITKKSLEEFLNLPNIKDKNKVIKIEMKKDVEVKKEEEEKKKREEEEKKKKEDEKREGIVKQKLGLFNLIISTYNPKETYTILKKV